MHTKLPYLALAFGAGATWVIFLATAATRGRRPSRCPYCASEFVRPSWQTIPDKIVGLHFVKPFRCERCQKRFFAMR